ncbi:hypothetical protein E2C01_069720 [Portunus trituberculatus]|uniref:Uncharacterized protein n=1 Tax=Portunus trituberculatus TaxID=210409 RepID=A0A5B7HZB0_PORTR|nr:hypothetical protein [Portunus trituberculatus]
MVKTRGEARCGEANQGEARRDETRQGELPDGTSCVGQREHTGLRAGQLLSTSMPLTLTSGKLFLFTGSDDRQSLSPESASCVRLCNRRCCYDGDVSPEAVEADAVHVDVWRAVPQSLWPARRRCSLQARDATPALGAAPPTIRRERRTTVGRGWRLSLTAAVHRTLVNEGVICVIGGAWPRAAGCPAWAEGVWWCVAVLRFHDDTRAAAAPVAPATSTRDSAHTCAHPPGRHGPHVLSRPARRQQPSAPSDVPPLRRLASAVEPRVKRAPRACERREAVWPCWPCAARVMVLRVRCAARGEESPSASPVRVS